MLAPASPDRVAAAFTSQGIKPPQWFKQMNGDAFPEMTAAPHIWQDCISCLPFWNMGLPSIRNVAPTDPQSEASRNATINGVPWSVGSLGPELEWDGSTDNWNVDVGGIDTDTSDDPFSMAFLLRHADQTPGQINTIVDNLQGASPFEGIFLTVRGDVAGDPVRFNLRGSSGVLSVEYTFGDIFPDTNYHSFVVSYNGNSAESGVSGHSDGVKLGQTEDSDTLGPGDNTQGTGTMLLGDRPNFADNTWLGGMAFFAFWRRALPDPEALAISADITKMIRPAGF